MPDANDDGPAGAPVLTPVDRLRGWVASIGLLVTSGALVLFAMELVPDWARLGLGWAPTTYVAILAALVVPRIMGRTDDAKRTATKVQIRNIEGALQLYKLDNGVYPTTEQGLKALVEKPSVGVVPKKWKLGGYLPNIPEDPWGNPYKYLSPAPVQQGQYGQVKGDYEITSFGTDGEAGGEGVNADITNWNMEKD